MAVSVRSLLMSGVSVVGATAIAIAPVQAPPPQITAHSNVAPVRVVSDEFVQLLASVRPAAEPGDPVALNSAGDAVINAWNRALPWIDYWVELAAYVVDFIPFGYFIPIGFDLSAQIDMFYFTLIRPIANSFVVDLVAPVVDDPLNLDSYITGLRTLGSVTWNSLQNFAIQEFNFFFGWLIPPLPPIPPLQSAVEGPTMAKSLSAGQDEATTVLSEGAGDTDEAGQGEDTGKTGEAAPQGTENTEGTETSEQIDGTAPTEEVDETEQFEETAEVDETEEVDEAPEVEPTKSTNGTVAAQGEVRGSGVEATDPTGETTAGADDTSTGDNQAQAPADTADTQAPADNDADSGDDGGADAGGGDQT
ncbi:hypothetical protein [Mycolicibacterium holsaticum]|uniref:hypothetical protein n=1 Tax=Mycolicibacterium holsaticum TaxID=152142 RepID=UPI001C7CB0D8|nr:hypothetical protein [Mycolicibacterium holsaticum]MDA4105876.1 hypothetical protein [Mycolicibacterium holsaticum DSM 44478 = JCM 12374]QZA13773.1 hypothetical protein K3U96_06435 [Mycolicibacterium holsaticum DSM 44478 = JCM 12374]UNC08766.1 hypothetical protein H5U41_20400 [Mycolicibacterium holsaticum DSM 44478 = JCM 12374]